MRARHLWKSLTAGVLLAAAGCTAAHLRQPEARTVAGRIIFTNNTPPDLESFPVQLFTVDRKRQVAATTADARGHFTLSGIRPGGYLVRLTWAAEHCTLWYRVDLTRGSREIEALMDVDCAHRNGAVLDPYRG